MNGVALTSLLVAAMRAAETNRTETEGRLFSDPFAQRLAGEEGEKLLQRALAEVGPQPAIAIRTAYFDERVSKALADGVRQIIIVASGMDSRAYRLDFPEGTKVFELDQPEVLKYKADKLGDAKPICLHHVIPADLRVDWSADLVAAGLNRAERSLWIVEGLLMYLNETQVTTLLERINKLALPNDIFLSDILSRALLDAPHMQKQLNFLTSIGAPWLFGTDEPEAMMKTLGWEAIGIQPGDYAPHRWPFPSAPRGAPRSCYLEAIKS